MRPNLNEAAGPSSPRRGETGSADDNAPQGGGHSISGFTQTPINPNVVGYMFQLADSRRLRFLYDSRERRTSLDAAACQGFAPGQLEQMTPFLLPQRDYEDLTNPDNFARFREEIVRVLDLYAAARAQPNPPETQAPRGSRTPDGVRARPSAPASRHPPAAIAVRPRASRIRVVAPHTEAPRRAGTGNASRAFEPPTGARDTVERTFTDQAIRVPKLEYTLDDGLCLQLVITDEVIAQLTAVCRPGHQREVGGLLIGYHHTIARCDDKPTKILTIVTDILPITSEDSSTNHWAVNERDWGRVDASFDRTFGSYGKARLGWYHTHPFQGIFFSGRDRDFHMLFRMPFQVALVIDPRSMEVGLFHWRRPDCEPEELQLGSDIRFRLSSLSGNADTVTALTGDAGFVTKGRDWRIVSSIVLLCITSGAIIGEWVFRGRYNNFRQLSSLIQLLPVVLAAGIGVGLVLFSVPWNALGAILRRSTAAIVRCTKTVSSSCYKWVAHDARDAADRHSAAERHSTDTLPDRPYDSLDAALLALIGLVCVGAVILFILSR